MVLNFQLATDRSDEKMIYFNLVFFYDWSIIPWFIHLSLLDWKLLVPKKMNTSQETTLSSIYLIQFKFGFTKKSCFIQINIECLKFILFKFKFWISKNTQHTPEIAVFDHHLWINKPTNHNNFSAIIETANLECEDLVMSEFHIRYLMIR